jgi:hypothetical protein
MKKLILFIVLALFVSRTALAASCYTQEQFEAEQGLRIHSELMVIALTCMKAPGGGPDMYKKYQAFTKKNLALIAQYETNMVSFFRTQGTKNSEETINNFKTGLANDISQHAISMSTASFCQHFGKRIDQALAMDGPTLRKWAQQVWPKSPPSHPICNKK